MKRLLMILIVICLTIGLCLSIGLLCACCTNTIIEKSTTEELTAEETTTEVTNTYAWITRWEHRYWYTNGDKSAPVVIEGYVKTWNLVRWKDTDLISITFVNGETYITGADNVLIKETE